MLNCKQRLEDFEDNEKKDDKDNQDKYTDPISCSHIFRYPNFLCIKNMENRSQALKESQVTCSHRGLN